MGAALSYLDQPVLETEETDGASPSTADRLGVAYGACAMQGWRRAQEDAHITEPEFDGSLSLFAVFDGHGGAEVALWCGANFGAVLKAEAAYAAGDYPRALRDAFLRVDAMLREPAQLAELERLQRAHAEGQRRTNDAHAPAGSTDDDGNDDPQAALIKRVVLKHMASNGGQFDITQFVGGVAPPPPPPPGAVPVDTFDDDGVEENETDEPEEARDDNDSSQEEGGASPSVADDMASPSAPRRASARGEKKGRKPSAKADDDDDEDDDDDDDDDAEDEDDDDDDDDAMEAEEGAALSEEDDDDENDGPGFGSGCTAVVVLVDRATAKLWCANAGDSRAVLVRGGAAVALSADHKPEDAEETRRIEAAGGKVVGGRVDGNLNLSRALGDLRYKAQTLLGPHEQRITALPDVIEVGLDPAKDTGLVIVCDGITGVLTDDQIVQHVLDGAVKNNNHQRDGDGGGGDLEKPSTATADDKPPRPAVQRAVDLCKACVARDTSGDGTGCDNETVLVVEFSSHDPSNNNNAQRAGSQAPNNNESLQLTLRPRTVGLEYPPLADDDPLAKKRRT